MAKQIVWIEDDIDIIYPVIRPLELAGFTILKYRTVRDANEAMEQVRNADLILLDMLLPKGSEGSEVEDYEGLQLLREWRAAYGEDFPPVVAFSVITSDRVVSQLRKLKVAGIIRKPERPSQLKLYIEKVLQSASDGRSSRPRGIKKKSAKEPRAHSSN